MTKKELTQIRQIIREENEPIKKGINFIKLDIVEMKKDIKRLDKNQSITISFFDRDYTGLRKRVDSIEDNLGLSKFS